MPKRPDAKRVRAAVAAGDPPKSTDYPDDDDWHDAQNEWLSKWSVRVLLDGPLRRWQWDDRVQEHKRLMAAAARKRRGGATDSEAQVCSEAGSAHRPRACACGAAAAQEAIATEQARVRAGDGQVWHASRVTTGASCRGARRLRTPTASAMRASSRRSRGAAPVARGSPVRRKPMQAHAYGMRAYVQACHRGCATSIRRRTVTQRVGSCKFSCILIQSLSIHVYVLPILARAHSTQVVLVL